jgi:hypothetical protein
MAYITPTNPASLETNAGRARPARGLKLATRAAAGLLACAGLVIGGQIAPAQAEGETPVATTISGRVQFASGEPGAGYVLHYDNTTCAAPHTDVTGPNSAGKVTASGPDGAFSFAAIAGQCYSLEITRDTVRVHKFKVDGGKAGTWAYVKAGSNITISVQDRLVQVRLPGTPASARVNLYKGDFRVGTAQLGAKHRATFAAEIGKGYTIRYVATSGKFYNQTLGGDPHGVLNAKKVTKFTVSAGKGTLVKKLSLTPSRGAPSFKPTITVAGGGKAKARAKIKLGGAPAGWSASYSWHAGGIEWDYEATHKVTREEAGKKLTGCITVFKASGEAGTRCASIRISS